MPFTMTHLYIAKNIYKFSNISIKDLSQFYLGTIAPDAVHNRANYKPEYKKLSHLYAGEEGWGKIANNDEWIENAINLLLNHRNSKNYDFILGYCVHILSDVYNNIAVWTPLKQKYQLDYNGGFHQQESEKLDYGRLYQQENEKIDIELALILDNKDDFWYYIEKSKAISLNDVIFEDEIEKQKENILYHWYKDKERQDISSNKLITIQSTMKFIEDASNFIIDKLACLL